VDLGLTLQSSASPRLSPGPLLAAGSADGTIRLWNLASLPPASLGSITLNRPLYALALSPNGQLLALSSLAQVGSTPLVSLWNPATQTQTGMLETGPTTVSALAFASNNTTLAAGNQQGKVQLWNAVTASLLLTLDTTTGHSITSLAFGPDGSMLAVQSSDRFQVWDVASGTRIRGYVDPDVELALAFSPDQCSLAVSGGPELDVLDIASGEFYLSLTTGIEQYQALSLAFSPDGRLLANGYNDGSVVLWGVPGGLQPGVFPVPACGLLQPFPTPSP
jgi:WD40 repeat protein